MLKNKGIHFQGRRSPHRKKKRDDPEEEDNQVTQNTEKVDRPLFGPHKYKKSGWEYMDANELRFELDEKKREEEEKVCYHSLVLNPFSDKMSPMIEVLTNPDQMLKHMKQKVLKKFIKSCTNF